MSKKSSQGPNKGRDQEIPFDQEKEKFMGMVGDVLSNKEFSSPEEANKFLNEAFSGRSMSNSLAEWDTRPTSLLDQARQVINQLPNDCTAETEKRYAKKSLKITPDCMEAWEMLAWSYRSGEKIEATLLEGLAHGRTLHADLIAEVGEGHGLWGYHEARPFMRLLGSLSAFYNQDGPVEKVVEVYEEMISLNPGDNQGIRGRLLHKYLSLKRLNDAEKLVEQNTGDQDLGIVYGRVLLELLKTLDVIDEFGIPAGKDGSGRISPSAFGPPFAKAKARMKEAIQINPYVPLLITHPTSLYLELPATFQVGSPDQAMIFINDHGVDWCTSMIGWRFVCSFQIQAKVQVKKASRTMRESYKDLVNYLDGIDEPPWQEKLR